MLLITVPRFHPTIRHFIGHPRPQHADLFVPRFSRRPHHPRHFRGIPLLLGQRLHAQQQFRGVEPLQQHAHQPRPRGFAASLQKPLVAPVPQHAPLLPAVPRAFCRQNAGRHVLERRFVHRVLVARPERRARFERQHFLHFRHELAHRVGVTTCTPLRRNRSLLQQRNRGRFPRGTTARSALAGARAKRPLVASRLHVGFGEGSPRFWEGGGLGSGEDEFAGERGEEGDLGKGGSEEIKIGNEKLAVVATNHADLAAGHATVAEEKPGGGVRAGQTDRVGTERTFVVAGREMREMQSTSSESHDLESDGRRSNSGKLWWKWGDGWACSQPRRRTEQCWRFWMIESTGLV